MFEFIRKLLKKEPQKAAKQDPQTMPLAEEQLATVTYVPTPYTPAQVLVGSGQSTGKQRDHNEDTLLMFNAIVADGGIDMPFGVFIIADGMGGHLHGEAASNAAARAMADTLVRKMYLPILGITDRGFQQSIQETLEEGVRNAHQAVIIRAPGGGTTLTTALLMGDQVSIAHVGDSRAYFLFPDGRVQVITQDHSLVRRLVELGQLSEADAQSHPQRSVLYRAIGQSEPYRADIQTLPAPRPGYLMICSDGLWGVVSEADIFRIIKNSNTPSDACKAMVEAANEAGGPDNISIILVQFL